MKALVTGASGYLGGHVCTKLLSAGWHVRALVREANSFSLVDARIETPATGDLASFDGWQAAMEGCDVVIHCAGLAHISSSSREYDASRYAVVNRDVVFSIARAAKEVQMPKLVFISSVAAYGNRSGDGVLSELAANTPTDPYGISKLEAEQGIAEILDNSSVQHLSLRPPMIYGRFCPGNFAKLARLVKLGIPLPMGSLICDRTLLAVDNLVDFIAHVIEHPHTGSGVFNIADQEILTLQELLEAMSVGMQKKCRLFPFPASQLKLAATIVGRRELVEKLTHSVVLDCSKARETFSWDQPRRAKDCIAEAAASLL